MVRPGATDPPRTHHGHLAQPRPSAGNPRVPDALGGGNRGWLFEPGGLHDTVLLPSS